MTTALIIAAIWLTTLVAFVCLMAGIGRRPISAGPVHGACAADDVLPRTSLISPVLPTFSDRSHGVTGVAGAIPLQVSAPSGPVSSFSNNARLLNELADES